MANRFKLDKWAERNQNWMDGQKPKNREWEHEESDLKGTVPRDFSPLVFFFKQLLLVPVDMPSNDFDFFRIFAEIFDFSGALPMSTTPAKQMILL